MKGMAYGPCDCGAEEFLKSLRERDVLIRDLKEWCKRLERKKIVFKIKDSK